MAEFISVSEKRRLLENLEVLIKAPGKADENTFTHLFEDLNKLFSEVLQEDVRIALIKNKGGK
ncbi:hypothetical protein A9Z54_04970 [Acinetobacter sp. 51m]|nr:hypothetical protein A9Z54_04970 [Acinetobacter sp. 51m]